MRLTLRTLLAYLDDILEPSQAKEIGEKIGESGFAAETVARIRDVLRRRRITAPELTGPGSGPDPNLMAEYLDNTLAPDAVAEVERLCLDSDIHLAEVAACHQVLTLVLGEPVEIPNEMRERMYVLGASPAGSDSLTGAGTTGAGTATAGSALAAQAEAASPMSGSAAATGPGLPDYLVRTPWWQRVLPVLALLLIVGVWIGVVFTDRSLFTTSVPDRPPSQDDVNDPGRGDRSDAAVAAIPATGSAVGENAAADAAPPEPNEGSPMTDPVDSQPDRQVTDRSINPLPPPDQIAPAADGATPKVAMPNEAEESAAATAEATAPDAGAASQATPQNKPAANTPRILYTSSEGILLHRTAETGRWMVMPRRALIHANDRLASPEPFDARLVVGPPNGCEITLMGGTALTSHVPADGAAFAFEMDRGRLKLHRPESEPPIVFDLRVGQNLWRVELVEPETVCGIEMIPQTPESPPADDAAPHFDGGLFVAAGGVRVTDSEGKERVLTPDAPWLPYPNSLIVAPAGSTMPLPGWLSPDGPMTTASFRSYAKMYEKEFLPDQPVAQSIPAVVKDRRPKVSELAVRTLALTDNYPELLRALGSEHEEARLAAIQGLREWLPQSPENDERLQDELSRLFRDEDVEALRDLLWGYSAEDARNEATSRQLVQWLADDEIAVRELAFFHIDRLTGRKFDYRSMAPPAQLQSAVLRWEEHIKRTGALLPP